MAIASRIVFEIPSFSDGSTNTSIDRMMSGTSLRRPANQQISARPRSRLSCSRSLRSGPSPAISRRTRSRKAGAARAPPRRPVQAPAGSSPGPVDRRSPQRRNDHPTVITCSGPIGCEAVDVDPTVDLFDRLPSRRTAPEPRRKICRHRDELIYRPARRGGESSRLAGSSLRGRPPPSHVRCGYGIRHPRPRRSTASRSCRCREYGQWTVATGAGRERRVHRRPSPFRASCRASAPAQSGELASGNSRRSRGTKNDVSVPIERHAVDEIYDAILEPPDVQPIDNLNDRGASGAFTLGIPLRSRDRSGNRHAL